MCKPLTNIWSHVQSHTQRVPVHISSPPLSHECSETQYLWPIDVNKLCCKKCPPGEFIRSRDPHTCTNLCEKCRPGWFTDSYNAALKCTRCKICDNRENLVLQLECNVTHDTVCRCQPGYRCTGQPCDVCQLIPTPTPTPTQTTPTPRHRPNTSTAASKPVTLSTLGIPTEPSRENNSWLVVIIVVLCATVLLMVVLKVRPLLDWIRSKHGCFFREKIAIPATEEDSVSKPIQEVCRKCDQPIDV
ncbi:uncharacterized protein LOC143003890 isoform X2 [Genypterus blacodes]|uniref:uncharacterized protein LOC143003890 isoform X2 n=1 Tax=Genypterus blacodes TaxID=154954 RepID=UPI003F75FE37